MPRRGGSGSRLWWSRVLVVGPFPLPPSVSLVCYRYLPLRALLYSRVPRERCSVRERIPWTHAPLHTECVGPARRTTESMTARSSDKAMP